MNSTKFRPLDEGQYVLARDVKNPSADRRHKRSVEFAVTWEAGTKFDVAVHSWDFEDKHVEYNTIKPVNSYGSISHSHDGFQALVDALVPAERTVETLAHKASEAYASKIDLFEILVDKNGWTLDQIEDLVDQAIERSEDKAEAEEKVMIAARKTTAA
jgi:hypothetical protein